MKIIVAIVSCGMFLSSASAQTLSCRSSGAPGSLVKTLIFEQTNAGVTVKIESTLSPGENKVGILSKTSTPVSMMYELDANTGMKSSLVVYNRQAVMLYESADPKFPGANVEFLICK